MSKVKTRAFTVPVGSTFVCLPFDGEGPCFAREGETVMIVVAHRWEDAFREAMHALMKPESK